MTVSELTRFTSHYKKDIFFYFKEKKNKLSITLISSHVIMKPAQSKPFFFFLQKS